MRMAIASVRLARPLADQTLPMNKDILVVGGGVAGMTAALRLADLGYKVHLVERFKELGGVAKQVRRTLEGEDVQAYVADLVKRTEGHERIQVWKQSMVVDHSGMAGMFRTGIQVGPQMFYREIRHGITILATGALPNRPQEYLLGRHQAVTTQLDLGACWQINPEAVQELAERRHDSMRRFTRARESQLFPGVLPGGRQKRPADPGTESRSPDFRALSRHAHAGF